MLVLLYTLIQPDHDQQFLSGSKFYFFVAAHKSVNIEKAMGCEVWIPFQGRTRVWTPKSITIRKMMISPDIVPPVGKLNDISYPILKFYFDGRISLIENFRLFAARKIYFYPILLEFERAPDIPLEEMEKVSVHETCMRQICLLLLRVSRFTKNSTTVSLKTIFG